jgi:hypothetical protein
LAMTGDARHGQFCRESFIRGGGALICVKM